MNESFRDLKICVFDAYGTLFDGNSAARKARDEIGDKWEQLAETWRSKQLQYTWLRSIAGRYVDFLQVTGDALDFAMASLQIENLALRERLLKAYLTLDAFPDTAEALTKLKNAGMKLGVLSNGTSTMLAELAANAGLSELFDEVLSVEAVRVYKPQSSVYQLARDRFGVPANRICFVSSNGWDAYSAQAFGFRVVWCNRLKQAPERIPERPEAEILSLAELPAILVG